MSCVISGVLGDLLVVEWDISLRVLMWISGVFVWTGFAVGLVVIRSVNQSSTVRSRHSSSASEKQARDNVSPSFDQIYSNDHTHNDEAKKAPSEIVFFKDSPFAHHRSQSKTHIPSNDELHLLHPSHHHPSRSKADSMEQSQFVKRVFEGEQRSTTLREKLTVFTQQLRYLRMALNSFAFTTMLVLWIAGNAIFSVSFLRQFQCFR